MEAMIRIPDKQWDRARRMTTAPPAYTLNFSVDEPAPGAPRMTRADAWKKRPCVLAYRLWRDRLREKCPDPPPAELVKAVEIYAFYAMPESWSAKKKRRMAGQPMRSKPDGDNVAKGVFDALWSDDHKLGDQTVRRRWFNYSVTEVRIDLVASAPAGG